MKKILYIPLVCMAIPMFSYALNIAEAEVTINDTIEDSTNSEQLVGNNPATYTPQHLSVPKFKSCLGKEAVQDAIYWCLPKERLADCPESSWSELQTMNLVPCMSNQNVTEEMPGIAIQGNSQELV